MDAQSEAKSLAEVREIVGEALRALEDVILGAKQAAAALTDVLNVHERGERLDAKMVTHLRLEYERVHSLNARGQAAIEALRGKFGILSKIH